MVKIAIVHGPNLNLLGTREPSLYGNQSLDSINQRLGQIAEIAGVELSYFQSNLEGELINHLQAQAAQDVRFIIFNPAALTHTSIALRDTLLAINVPFVEVHLSNIYKREVFRHHSYFRDIAVGVISGFGPFSYELALQAALNYLEV